MSGYSFNSDEMKLSAAPLADRLCVCVRIHVAEILFKLVNGFFGHSDLVLSGLL